MSLALDCCSTARRLDCSCLANRNSTWSVRDSACETRSWIRHRKSTDCAQTTNGKKSNETKWTHVDKVTRKSDSPDQALESVFRSRCSDSTVGRKLAKHRSLAARSTSSERCLSSTSRLSSSTMLLSPGPSLSFEQAPACRSWLARRRGLSLTNLVSSTRCLCSLWSLPRKSEPKRTPVCRLWRCGEPKEIEIVVSETSLFYNSSSLTDCNWDLRNIVETSRPPNTPPPPPLRMAICRVKSSTRACCFATDFSIVSNISCCESTCIFSEFSFARASATSSHRIKAHNNSTTKIQNIFQLLIMDRNFVRALLILVALKNDPNTVYSVEFQ